jgi:pimeloyl-ACP methyl ester carboxylesterase
MWTPQVEALSGDYHCLVPDLPEHGRSFGLGSFSIEDATARVADLIRRCAHGGQAHVVGLSLGAQVTVALLALAPDLVGRAIVSSALLRPLPGGSFWYRPDLLAATYRWTVEPFKGVEWYMRLNMKYAAAVPERYVDHFRKDYQLMTADSFARVIAANMSFRLPPGLARVTVPTLVVAGQHEYGAMKQSVRDLVSALPNARGALVDAGRGTAESHNWNLTAPELFTRTVRAWLTDQPLPAELRALP